eukprot:CAMPEP_0196145232 /NCGR_PEP_ID=MMETSP0910-20130528/19596_1 /TAXON_ID=49265 /ORGANISM="Thalassiosira rotula, Strain GSO102" /LENGTH=334 /DNA_ID=CAMNT_0041407125 /DNA_START=26 /DNA_END=1027 /DNA_ORIENTATION=+
MMIFDTNPSDDNNNIVIVPPQPDFAFQTQDEFSYSNLYCYDDTVNNTSTTNTTATANAGTTPSRSVSVATNSTSTLSSKESSTTAIADTNSTNDKNTKSSRDPRNGAFTFQVHAEYDLLLHIQKDLDKHRNMRRGQGKSSSDDVELSRLIMKSVDEYCLQKQWMYHIGSEKGVAIGRFLRAGVESFRDKQLKQAMGGEVKKFICVELGTYCGYSALVLASTLRQFMQEQEQQNQNQPFEFQIYTTEVSSKLLNVAQSVFRLAKMEHYITPILVNSDDDASKIDEAEKKNRQRRRSELSQTLLNQHGATRIDFLLLDHAKHLYLDDLRDLEDAGL